MSSKPYALYKRCDCAVKSKCLCAWHMTIRRAPLPRFYCSLERYRKCRGIVEPLRSRAEAEELADAIAITVADGTYSLKPKQATPAPPSASSPGERTFATTSAALLEELASLETLNDEQSRHRRLNAWTIAGVEAPVGAWPLESFTADLVIKIFNTLTKGQSNSSKQKYARVLRKAFELAVRNEWLARSPFAGELPRKPLIYVGKASQRWERVESETMEALLDSAQRLKDRGRYPWFKAFLVAMLESGCRPGELAVMRIRDVLFDRRCFVVAAIEAGGKKTGKRGEPGRSRLAPMEPLVKNSDGDIVSDSRLPEELAPLLVGLDGRPLPPNAYLFHDGTGAKLKCENPWRNPWMYTLAGAYGIEIVWRSYNEGGNINEATRAKINELDSNIYDIRHEAALRWLAEGTHVNVIAKMLGHKDIEQLKVYLGIHDDDAIDSYARTRGAVVAPSTARKRRPVLVKGNSRTA